MCLPPSPARSWIWCLAAVHVLGLGPCADVAVGDADCRFTSLNFAHVSFCRGLYLSIVLICTCEDEPKSLFLGVVGVEGLREVSKGDIVGCVGEWFYLRLPAERLLLHDHLKFPSL